MPHDTDSPAALHAQIGDLTKALAARDAFLSTVAHELRNPMTPIVSQAGRLLQIARAMDAPPPEPLVVGLERLQWLIERYMRRATVLLDVSRVNAGNLRLHPVAVPLAPLVDEAILAVAPNAQYSGCEIETDIPDGIVGYWDRLALEQILDNLLTNAIKYGAGRPIGVTATRTRENLALAVSDRGIGIGEEDRARIFDMFERVVGAERRSGFGVGLWIVRRLAEAMGGTIAVDSAPGAGSTFTVTLPLRSPGE